MRRLIISIFLLCFCVFAEDKDLDQYLPKDIKIVKHTYYDLKFDNMFKVPCWTIYQMTEKNQEHKFPRGNLSFKTDEEVSESVTSTNYSGNGFDLGHMVPANDMEFDQIAVVETFLTTNVCPQYAGFNRGVWKELENQVRVWSSNGKKLIVVTGPIFNGSTIKTIGNDKVGVPDAFFKIIYDVNEKKGVGFIIKHINNTKDLKLENFITTITDVEGSVPLEEFNFENKSILSKSLTLKKKKDE